MSSNSSRAVADLRLLDVNVRVILPAQMRAMLVPYLASKVVQPAADLRIEVSPSRTVDRGWEVAADQSHECDRERLPSALLSAINIGVLSRTRLLAIHAGVVGGGAGAVAFPGTSGSGKSTITAACLQVGLTYISDEALCLDPNTGLVHPFPRPLSLSSDSLDLIGQRRDCPQADHLEYVLSAEQLGGLVEQGLRPLAHIVLANHRGGSAHLRPSPRRNGVTALLRHAFNHYRMPAAAFDTAWRAAADAQVWRLDYNDPREGANLVRSRLGGDP